MPIQHRYQQISQNWNFPMPRNTQWQSPPDSIIIDNILCVSKKYQRLAINTFLCESAFKIKRIQIRCGSTMVCQLTGVLVLDRDLSQMGFSVEGLDILYVCASQALRSSHIPNDNIAGPKILLIISTFSRPAIEVSWCSWISTPYIAIFSSFNKKLVKLNCRLVFQICLFFNNLLGQNKFQWIMTLVHR